jgi:hypothetical protein
MNNSFEFCNDQPGRLLAVFIIAPILMIKGLHYNDYFIISFSLILFIWDLYHIIYSKPNKPLYYDIEKCDYNNSDNKLNEKDEINVDEINVDEINVDEINVDENKV